jgi:restriction system protein
MKFFEHLIKSLLLSIGYGGGDPDAAQVVGGPGDEGVDVVVRLDVLGLDRVLVQAKRYARSRSIGPEAVRQLAGSLSSEKASKGLLVTTAAFTEAAKVAAEKVANRVVVIDGDELARLMIRYGVGVRIEETFHVKKVDEDFFLE